MLLGTLDASIYGNMLGDKGTIAVRQGRHVGVTWAGNRCAQAGDGVMRIGQNF